MNYAEYLTHGGNAPGTMVCEPIACDYACWISPEFHLKARKVFLSATAECASDPEPEKEVLEPTYSNQTRDEFDFGESGNTNLPIISGVEVTTDEHGRFNLNALYRASRGDPSKN